jgi:glycosyltransferase involved in cell wall biosynthesis
MLPTSLSPSPSPTASRHRCQVRPVFTVGGLYSLANGVAWIMRDLAAALGRQGSPVTVCAAECWGRGARSVHSVFEEPTRWVSARGLWLGGLSWAPGLPERMAEVIADADLVHNHSLWMLPNSYGSRIAARQSKPVIVTAHGALEPWAMRNSGWKKKIVGRLFQNQDLQQASCIHVNSQAEVEGIRRYGLNPPVAVIPNGINPEPFENLPDADLLHSQFPELQNKLLVLFMARLHEKKGLGHLIPAWGNVAKEFPDWHLAVAGPDRGYEATARQLVKDLQISSSVTFVGNLQGDQKLSALAAAEIFVQPSFSEGFSMSVLEALAARCPVLITPGCNFPEVAEAEAGIIAEPDVEKTTQALRSLLKLSHQKRQAMGSNAHQLIRRGYTWDHVAGQTLDLYSWLVRGGPAPAFVVR